MRGPPPPETPESLRAKADAIRWFHSIDLGMAYP